MESNLLKLLVLASVLSAIKAFTQTEASAINGPIEKAKTHRPIDLCASFRAVCQNFHRDIVKLINIQINEEFKASYTYLAMAAYFGRDDVARHGFAKFFHEASMEERKHGVKLIEYLNKRGGKLELLEIKKPDETGWDNGLDALRSALRLERHVNSKLLDLHWEAQEHNDAHLADYLEANYLNEQVDAAKELSDLVSRLDEFKGAPIGEYLIDKELREKKEDEKD